VNVLAEEPAIALLFNMRLKPLHFPRVGQRGHIIGHIFVLLDDEGRLADLLHAGEAGDVLVSALRDALDGSQLLFQGFIIFLQ